MRRGKPSLHMAFNEATAILAGDALQALAFRVLAEDDSISPTIRLNVVSTVAQACGSMGMAGGQVIDLAAVGQKLSVQQLETMHRLKTGALISACLTSVGQVACAGPKVIDALGIYGDRIGLAFQIRDDVLDVIGDSALTGKPGGADAIRQKPTFPSILGVEESSERARTLRDEAICALDSCPGDIRALNELAHYVVARDR